MNLYGHIALSSLACDTALLNSKIRFYSLNKYRYFSALAFFIAGVFLHILIDSLPHFDFLYKLKMPLINKWWLKQSVFAFIYIAVLFPWQSRKFLLVKISAVLGGLYPVAEKLLYFGNILPQNLVVFKHHSMHLSQQPDYYLCRVYIVFEIAVAVCALFFAFLIKRRYEDS